MKVYRGERLPDGCQVTVEGRPLDPRLDLRALTTSGFEWGYEGSGPAQLAIAILADHLGDDQKALDGYRSFRDAVIAELKEDAWTIDSNNIDQAMAGTVEVPMTLDELFAKVRGG